MSGEDITVILFLLVAVFLVILAGSVDRVASTLTEVQENMTVNVRTEGMDVSALKDFFQATTEYRLFIGIQKYLANVTSVEELLNKYLVITVKLTKSERASIMLHDEKRDELYIYKTIGWDNREIHLAKKMKSRPGEGIAGRVFLDGEPLVVNKASDTEDLEIKDKYKSKSFVSFPIFEDQAIIGVLNLTEKGEASYTQGEMDILRYITGIVALRLQGLGRETLKRY
jgi:transcriptional regulator with GAF, ATPase, and Fis domain